MQCRRAILTCRRCPPPHEAHDEDMLVFATMVGFDMREETVGRRLYLFVRMASSDTQI
jgi:hypothetical protein